MGRVASFYDNRGLLHVDCTECDRGINGSNKHKCCAGWRFKDPGHGCFTGKILEDVDLKKAEKLK